MPNDERLLQLDDLDIYEDFELMDELDVQVEKMRQAEKDREAVQITSPEQLQIIGDGKTGSLYGSISKEDLDRIWNDDSYLTQPNHNV